MSIREKVTDGFYVATTPTSRPRTLSLHPDDLAEVAREIFEEAGVPGGHNSRSFGVKITKWVNPVDGTTVEVISDVTVPRGDFKFSVSEDHGYVMSL